MDNNGPHKNGIVFIGSEDVLTAWSARPAPPGEVIGVTDADVQGALNAITYRQPRMVVLEQAFAATPRGAMLVSRLQTDPTLNGVEIRLLSSERRAQIPHLGAAISLAAIAHPLQPQYRMVRRTVRLRVPGETEVVIDGNPAILVDVSTSGAQVLLPIAVRPGQRVRVLLGGSLRTGANVVWAEFEMSHSPTVSRYRAGIEFLNAAARDLDELLWRVGVREPETIRLAVHPVDAAHA